MNAAEEYALSLADVAIDDIAFDSDATTWSLIDRAGDFAGLATWRQIEDSLAAGEEGWIEVHGRRFVYVDGNVELMNAALKAFWAVAS